MKRTFARALVAAFSIGCAGLAQAIPIYLDFTGKVTVATVDDGTLLGTSMSGGFTFETDQMSAFVLPGPGSARQVTYTQFTQGEQTEPVGYVNLGSEQVSWTANPYNRYGGVGFLDACTPDCVPGWAENLSWNALSNDFVPGADGVFTSRSLGLISANTIRFPDYPFVQYLDYFDSNDITPLSAVTLPLYDLVGVYSEEKFTCLGGECASSGQRLFNFSIDSVVRGVGPREVPVPEPGTLGLLSLGLAAIIARRRRRA